VPIENNEVLKSNSAPSLFLRNLDDIQSVVDSPLRWANSGSNILTYIEFSSIDLVWSKEWLPYSLADHSTYFLGLKLVNDNISEIGWIEFSIIKSDGTIDIIDKGVF
jgi:hypothetical protein